ncbi:MAG: polysaccharide biosynthesis protein [Lachnospiraceae bacterium]|nr:polysaccharide biosynthesis protein [Lachnospiraceae bacterium]
MKKHPSPLIAGTLILTVTGLISRLLGFVYRIYLSRTIGAEALGLYQMISPVSGICFALCCGPIQTAISRFSAQAGARCPQSGARRVFLAGLILSEALAVSSALILFRCAGFCAAFLLGEPRVEYLLHFLALSLPLSAAHAAINGYYYGKQQTAVPAVSQLAEQVVRVVSVYFLAGWLTAGQRTIDASVAAFGLVIGELAALAVTFFSFRVTLYRENMRSLKRCRSPQEVSCSQSTDMLSSNSSQRFRPRNIQSWSTNYTEMPDCESVFHTQKPLQKASAVRRLSLLPEMRRILTMALPLTANRLVLGLLQSAEAACIPGRLQAYGLSQSEAVSLYGVLTGMALPFIFFPSALTNSVAVMLLPSVAEAQSLQDHSRIRRASDRSICFSLYLGILCTGVFTLCGHQLGTVFFANETAGQYITILGWLCPFLYLSTTAASILNGMGRTGTTFGIHLTGLLIRLAFVLFLIPRWGMRACLLGMLTGELADSGLCLLALRREIRMDISVFHLLFRPMAAAFVGTRLAQPFLAATEAGSSLMRIAGIGTGCCVLVLTYGILLYITR